MDVFSETKEFDSAEANSTVCRSLRVDPALKGYAF